jgi:hypothetical protein
MLVAMPAAADTPGRSAAGLPTTDSRDLADDQHRSLPKTRQKRNLVELGLL